MVKIYEDNTERLAKLDRIADRNVQDRQRKEDELKREWKKIYDDAHRYTERVKDILTVAKKLDKLGLLNKFKTNTDIWIYSSFYGVVSGHTAGYDDTTIPNSVGCNGEGIASYDKAPYGGSSLSTYPEDYVGFISTVVSWNRYTKTPWSGRYSVDDVEKKIDDIKSRWNQFTAQFPTFEEEFYDYVDSLE